LIIVKKRNINAIYECSRWPSGRRQWLTRFQFVLVHISLSVVQGPSRNIKHDNCGFVSEDGEKLRKKEFSLVAKEMILKAQRVGGK